MTLRLKLMSGLVALSALGLVIAGAASALALHTYLADRVDQQLSRAQLLGGLPIATLLNRSGALERAGVERAIAPTDYLVEIRRANGTVLRITGSASPSPPSTPLLDIVDAQGNLATRSRGVVGPLTIVAGGERYRAVVRNVPLGPRALVALPLRPVAATVRRLVLVELAVGLVVLAATAALAWLWLTRGLRPLRQMIHTASAIAAGDLDRRVPTGSARSETGQLATALNTMLGQIQAAFAARIASQDQLRRFAADASHELRTPLTSIRGYADLLRGGMVAPADADDALRRVQEEATRMGVLVDDLLYLAHLDEQRPMRWAEVDLAVLVRDAVADLRAAAPDRPVTAEAPAGCIVIGDPDALRQLVGNLVTNARVHTPLGTPIEVRVYPLPAAGFTMTDPTRFLVDATGLLPSLTYPVAAPAGHLDRSEHLGRSEHLDRLEHLGHPEHLGGSAGAGRPDDVGRTGSAGAVLYVVDHGPGMPPEVAEHVFDRFYRAADTRARGWGGSGLGLSIVAAIAAAHGGRVDVHSVPGSGTIFRLVLPMAGPARPRQGPGNRAGPT